MLNVVYLEKILPCHKGIQARKKIWPDYKDNVNDKKSS